MNYKQLKHQKQIHGLEPTISKSEMAKLKKGMPIQKIMGFINFDNLRINVDRNVFIPRYETEEVIQQALSYIKKNYAVLDLCCGSGYIGLTIKQKTNAQVCLSDFSEEAILQTKENALLNSLNVEIVKSNLFSEINKKFNVIISNPPYIPIITKLSNSVLNFEPHSALFGGLDGNDILSKIIAQAPKYLKNKGVLILEIGPENAPFLLENNFKILKDLNNKERIAIKMY